MKNQCLILFLLFFTLCVNAQNEYQVTKPVDFYKIKKISTGNSLKTFTNSDIKGSPYSNDEFVNGDIYTTTKLKYEDIPLRYNIYNDEIEFKTPDDKIFALSTPEIVKKVIWDDNTMVYIPFSYLSKTKQGFFNTIYTHGKAELYGRLILDYREPIPASPYKDPQPARFIHKPDVYYIKIGDNPAKKVEHKKGLVKVFPDHQKKLNIFIKKNKISIKNENEMIQLIKYYNSLCIQQ